MLRVLLDAKVNNNLTGAIERAQNANNKPLNKIVDSRWGIPGNKPLYFQ